MAAEPGRWLIFDDKEESSLFWREQKMEQDHKISTSASSDILPLVKKSTHQKNSITISNSITNQGQVSKYMSPLGTLFIQTKTLWQKVISFSGTITRVALLGRRPEFECIRVRNAPVSDKIAVACFSIVIITWVHIKIQVDIFQDDPVPRKFQSYWTRMNLFLLHLGLHSQGWSNIQWFC